MEKQKFFDNIQNITELIGLFFYNEQGRYVGKVCEVEIRKRFTRTGELAGWSADEWYIRNNDDHTWHEATKVHYMTNGDYIRRKQNRGIVWSLNNIELGENRQTFRYINSKGEKVICEDLLSWIDSPYRAEFVVEEGE